MKRKIFLSVVLLLIFKVDLFANFGFYRSLTVDHTKVPSNQTDFTVLVSFSHADIRTVGDGGHVQNSSGFDLRPYAESALSTTLSFKLESYTSNGSTGTVVMWVKIPGTLSSSVDKVFYLAYGDSGLSSDGSSTGAWDSNYKAVFLMNETSGTTVNDSTSNADTGTAVRNITNMTTTGQISKAFTFDDTVNDVYDHFATIPSSTTFTVTAWVNIGTNNSGYRTIYAGSGAGPGLWLNARQIDWYDAGQGETIGSTTIAASAWHMIAVRHNGNGTSVLLYYDATLDATSSTNSTALPGGGTDLGVGAHNAISEPYNGVIDHLTISDIDRGADWITTSFNNQNNPGTFMTVGSENSVSASITCRRSLLGVGCEN